MPEKNSPPVETESTKFPLNDRDWSDVLFYSFAVSRGSALAQKIFLRYLCQYTERPTNESLQPALELTIPRAKAIISPSSVARGHHPNFSITDNILDEDSVELNIIMTTLARGTLITVIYDLVKEGSEVPTIDQLVKILANLELSKPTKAKPTSVKPNQPILPKPPILNDILTGQISPYPKHAGRAVLRKVANEIEARVAILLASKDGTPEEINLRDILGIINLGEH